MSIDLVAWDGVWPDGDPDGAFRAEVAAWSLQDPLPNLEALSKNLGIPVGALARHVLAKWAAAGAEALLELGPTVVARLAEAVRQAEEDGSDQARLAAWATVRDLVSWLDVGRTQPEVAYPRGGAVAPDDPMQPGA